MKETILQTVDLEALEQNKDLQSQFCQRIKEHGFGLVSTKLTGHVDFQQLFCSDLPRLFETLTIEDKLEMKYNSEIELGYLNNIELGKEFIAYRKPANGNHFPWTKEIHNKHAQTVQTVQALWDFMDSLAKKILNFFATWLQISPEKLVGMCEPSMPVGPKFESSMLHLFKYGSLPFIEEDPHCISHTDSGLVTIIPIASSPGLECLDWKTGKFFNPEVFNFEKPTFTILIGETLARILCLYVSASVHRVVLPSQFYSPSETNSENFQLDEKWSTLSEKVKDPKWKLVPRISTPFQLRASPQAVIDSEGLGATAFNVPQKMKEKIMLRDFIK